MGVVSGAYTDIPKFLLLYQNKDVPAWFAIIPSDSNAMLTRIKMYNMWYDWIAEHEKKLQELTDLLSNKDLPGAMDYVLNMLSDLEDAKEALAVTSEMDVSRNITVTAVGTSTTTNTK